MINIQHIRNRPGELRDAMQRRNEDAPLDRIAELDAERRSTIVEADELRARRNEVSREIGRTRERPQELIDEMRQVSARISALEATIRTLESEINDLLLALPNIPHEDVPDGADETANIVVRTEGEPPHFDFDPLPHWELGERLNIIDFQRGAKMAGSRFFVLKGKGARLQRALIDWMLDTHTSEHGYEELYLPNIVTTESATANSNLPKFADTMYRDDEDDLWLLPPAEMAITNMHRDEILDPGSLPIQYVAHTPCFRREKAAAGRDTRGIKRVHQFEKSRCTASSSRISQTTPCKACSARRRRYASDSASATACSNSAPATSASSPPRPTTSRCGRPAATSGSKSAHAPPAPTSRRAAPPSATAPNTAQGPASSTPSTVQDSRSPRHHRHPGELPASRRLSPHPRSPPTLHRLRSHRGVARPSQLSRALLSAIM